MSDPISSAPHLQHASTRTDLVDWGVQPGALVIGSLSSGKLVHKGAGNIPEAGIWVCTPGSWRLAIPRDELCHFVAGRATYTHDCGDMIDVAPNTVVLFQGLWSGVCTVHETIRTIYILV